MRPIVILSLGLTSIGHAGSTASEFSTPERAIATIEAAYRAKDLEAAVRAKDFVEEARLMLEGATHVPGASRDKDLIGKTAEVLELGFRTELLKKGFPDMNRTCTLRDKRTVRAGLVRFVERCAFPDGQFLDEVVHAAKTERGWRQVSVPPAMRN